MDPNRVRIILIRHGQAEPAMLEKDCSRALTAFGRKQSQEAACFIQSYQPTEVIASPYLRTQQTAKIIADHCNQLSIYTCPNLTPGAEPLHGAQNLCRLSGCCVVVTHMPLVTRLHGLLTAADTNAGVGFEPAMALCLSAENPGLGLYTVTAQYP